MPSIKMNGPIVCEGEKRYRDRQNAPFKFFFCSLPAIKDNDCRICLTEW